jgi:glycosyltransferase involved in cell wall biosynthesis
MPVTDDNRARAEIPATVLFYDHTAKLGGGEIALFHLLANLDKGRYRPIAVLGEEGALAEKLRKEEIEVCIMPLPGGLGDTRKDSLGTGSLLKLGAIFLLLGYCWKLRNFIRQRGVDLVHTNSLKADLIGGIAGRLAGVPVVWHVRDRIENDYLPPVVTTAFRQFCRIIPTFVVSNSAATMQTLRIRGRGKRAVIHSGHALVEGATAVVHDGVVPASMGVKRKGGIRVGMVGRLTRWKGQHIFLQAVADVRPRFPGARFQIVGSAMFGEEAYEEEIRALANHLGLANCVEFTGFRSDVLQLVEEMDVLVHASITGEPFGQVIVEAMAAGKPVVATNGGGVPEIVRHGVTGLLVPMGDAEAMARAICELLADPVRAEQMGLAGRDRVLRRFTVQVTARRLEYVFSKVLGRRGAKTERASESANAVTR